MFQTLIHKYLSVPYRLHVYTDKKSNPAIATVLLLHGMGNSSASWTEVVKRIPDGVRVISVDLLGFGDSPSPRWMKYNVSIQARSVIRTVIGLHIRQPLIIVGHSMGSLVAIEIAKRYPLLVKSLVLCSPPLYSTEQRRTVLPNQEALLKDFYTFIMKHPERIVDSVPLALKLKVVGSAFDVTTDNIAIYMAALESSILHQTSFVDAQRLKKPIQFVHGAFDPVVVKRNLQAITKSNKHSSLSVVVAGHELMGAYIPAVTKAIQIAIKQ